MKPREHPTLQIDDAPQTVTPWAALAAVISMVGIYGVSLGYTYPALSFNLEARGISASIIGAQSAMSGVGITVGALLTPWFIRRFGAWPTVLYAIVATALAIASFGIIENITIWYPLRFITGLTGSLLFVTSETWLNQLAPPHLRGRLIGIYTAVVAGMFALGPVLIPLIGFSGVLPFFSIAAIIFALGIPMMFLRGEVPDIEDVSSAILVRLLWVIPVLLLGIAVFGYLESALLSLWAVFALDGGVGSDRAAYLLTMFIVGNVVFQVPIGWLADHTSRRGLFAFCTAAGLAGALMLPYLDLNHWSIIPFLVVWGSLSFGTYTIALTTIGSELHGAWLLAANTGFSLAWGIGAIVGSSLTGGLMDVVGVDGLGYSLAGAYALLLAVTLFVLPVRAKYMTS